MQHGSSVFTRGNKVRWESDFHTHCPLWSWREDPDFEDGKRPQAKDLWGGLLKVDIAEKTNCCPLVSPTRMCKPHQKLDFTHRDPYQTSDLYNSKIKCLHLGLQPGDHLVTQAIEVNPVPVQNCFRFYNSRKFILTHWKFISNNMPHNYSPST